MKLVLAGLAGLFLLVLGFLRWRWAVVAALILVVLEGAIRKWIVPAASQYVYFAKDFLLLAAYAGFLMRDRDRRITVTFGVFPLLLGIAVLIVGLQVFNWRLGEPLIGLFGFKAYLLYAPLCFLVPHLFADADALHRFVRSYSLLIIPVCLLGAVQFARPGDSVLNQYIPGGDEGMNIAMFGAEGEARARITSTFSYISGLTVYLVVAITMVIPTFARPTSAVWFYSSVVEFILICGTTLMTGSRAAVLTVLVILACFFVLAGGGAIRGTATRLRGTLILVGISTVIAMGIWFQTAYDAFMHRVMSSGDTIGERVFQHSSEIDFFIESAGILGYGAGATHPGSEGLRRAFGLRDSTTEPPPSEAEYARILIELGLVGAFVWYVLRLYLLFVMFRTWQSLRDPFLRSLALSIFLLQCVTLNGAVVLNHTMGVYYWFLASFCFLLPRLDSELRRRSSDPLTTVLAKPLHTT